MNNHLLYHYVKLSANKVPDQCAIVDEQSSITYRELDSKSDCMAGIIRTAGVHHGCTVGIYLDKSIEAVIAFIAVLKAGACYIPLDSHYSPPERIKTILRQSGTRFVITSEQLWKRLSDTDTQNATMPDGQCTVLMVQHLLNKNNAAHHTIAAPTATENDLAYILYTSGSTGVPKGVMITHRNALTFVEWAVDEFTPVPGTVFANHAPFHFDLSVFDLYVAFATGGTVHIVPHAAASNPRALVKWIGDHAIQIWYSVPSVWVTILKYASIDAAHLAHLQTILFAGEVFPPKFLKQLMQQLPERSFYNLYGPTETNVCTYYRVVSFDEIDDEPVPIGKACPNTFVTALDETMGEVPTGGEGELFVRGPGVAAGYYRDPERTAASFVNDPSSPANERMYATGDIVRRISFDAYTYVGRKDLMVKCSGFRIELQEIEVVLCAMPNVHEAAVVACSRETLEHVQLHACLTTTQNTDVSVIDVKKWCAAKLPHYMIPEKIHFFETLPKNQNGKIDRCLLKTQCESEGAQ